MTARKNSYALALIKVGNGIAREKRWLKDEIRRRLPKLTRAELCAVKDLVGTLIKERGRVGPRNRRFMTRRKP
jgi:hypothetical protein